MHLPRWGRTRPHAGPCPLVVVPAVLTLLLLVAAFPVHSFAAAPGSLSGVSWADPDYGYWIELGLVTLITAVAGIVFNVRRKPDP